MEFSLALQSANGDFRGDFGLNSNIGFSICWRNSKNQILGLNYNFIHSQNVKNTSVINHLMNSQGWIINQNGAENLYVLYHRGGILSLDLGKIINTAKPNVNSGLFIKSGIGIMETVIKVCVSLTQPGMFAYV